VAALVVTLPHTLFASMVASFGTGDPLKRRPADVQLVEHWPSLHVHEAYRAGMLTGALSSRGDTRGLPAGQTRVVPRTIEVDGQAVEVGWHPALPLPVWICPRCRARRYKLVKVWGAWGCRGCFDLRWRCRARKGPKGLTRLLWLRRRLGSPIPFTPIQRPSLKAWKRIKMLAEVRRLEAQLARQTSVDVVDVLEKRYERRYKRQGSRSHP
jgi:hypothetical protein